MIQVLLTIPDGADNGYEATITTIHNGDGAISPDHMPQKALKMAGDACRMGAGFYTDALRDCICNRRLKEDDQNDANN